MILVIMMTEKRFTLKGLIEGVPNICDNDKIIEQEEAVMLLNELADENEELKNSNHRLSQNLINSLDRVIQLEKEIEQLKARNENQYNQLTELWEIIEEEKWEKLIAMKKQLKEDEEQLQREWRTYE